MALGPLIAMLLRCLPDVLFLLRRRAQHQDKEQVNEDEQEFTGALQKAADGNGDLDDAADLLERRLREARRVR